MLSLGRTLAWAPFAALVACGGAQAPSPASPPPTAQLAEATDVEFACPYHMHFGAGLRCVADEPVPPRFMERAPGSMQPITSDELQQVVSFHQVEIRRRCDDIPEAAPVANETVAIAIAADGSASAAASGNDPATGHCLEAEVGRWRFPATGVTANVNVPFKFVRGAGVAPSSTSTAPFDRAAAAASVRAVDLSDCEPPGSPSGRGKVEVTFDEDGTAAGARIDGPFNGTAVGGCILGKVRGAPPIPAFAGGPVVVTKTFVVP